MKIFGVIARMSEKRPWLVVIGVVVITIFMGIGFGRINMVTDNENMLPRGYESLEALETIESEFGNVNWQYAIITADDVTSPGLAMELNSLSIEAAEKAGVNEGDLTAIETYLDGLNKMQESNGSSSAGRSRSSEQVIQQLQMYLSSDYAKDRLFGEVISEDREATLVKFQLDTGLSEKDASLALEAFEDYLGDTFDGEGEKVYIAGSAAQMRDNNDMMMTESRLLLIFALAFLVLILFMTFRRVSDVVLPLLIMMVAVTWLFGCMGWIGISYTMMSIMIVPLMLGINIAYVIHLLSRYYEEGEGGKNPYEAVKTSMMTVGVAVFLTAITTVFGFVSFTISDMPPMRDFGFLCVLGVIFSFILSVTLLPAIMVIRDGRKSTEKREAHLKKIMRHKDKAWYGTFIDRILTGSAVAAYKFHWFVIGLLVVTVGFAVFAGVRLDTNADFAAFLPDDTPSVKANELMTEKFGTRRQDMILVEGDVLEPDNLKAMLKTEDNIAAESEEGEIEAPIERESIISIADVISEASESGIPESRAEVDAILSFLGQQMEVGSFVSGDNDTSMILLRTPWQSQSGMDALAKMIKGNTRQLEKDTGMEVSATGVSVIISDLLGNILPTQVKSSGLALLLCLLVLIIVFRSPLYGTATLFVVVFGVALELIVLYLIGWPLDIFTVTISSLVIGVGVDFGIHVTHRFREELNQGEPDIAEAIKKSVLHVGRALFAAALTTCGVFGIIGVSRMAGLSRFGITIAISLVGALIGAVLFLPSLLAVVAKLQARRSKPFET